MARITRVADKIYSIHPELNFMFSLSYLILDEKSALIDPGSTTQTAIVLKALDEELGFDPESLDYVIPTHLHLDHGGGAGYAAQQLPEAKIVVPERYKKQLLDPSILIKAFKGTFGDDFGEKFGQVLPVPEAQLFSIDDGDQIDLGSRQLEIIYTRGHANHHFCLLENRTQGLFCGDTLGMYFPQVDGIVTVCPEGFNLQLQLESIDRLEKLNPKCLFFAHEGTGHNPGQLMERVAHQLKDCAEVVRKSMENGDDSAQTARRLEEYFRSTVSTNLNYQKMFLSLTAGGYRKYLAKSQKTYASKGVL